MVEREPDKARLQLNPTPPSPRGVPLPDWLRSSLPGRIRSSDDRDDGPYVVLVDDDATVLEALASLVRSASFRVQAFPSTNAFLNSDQTSPPGCMVLDAWMPGQGDWTSRRVCSEPESTSRSSSSAVMPTLLCPSVR